MEDIEMEVDTPPASLSQSAGSRKHAITAFVSPTHADSGGPMSPIMNWGELRTLPVDGKWYSLGLQLGIGSRNLDAIQQSHPSSLFKCKVEMLKEWVRGDQTASWGQLISALHSVNEGSLADDLLSWHNAENLENQGSKNCEYPHSNVSHSSMKKHLVTDLEETDGITLQVKQFSLAAKSPPNSTLQAIRENYQLLLSHLPGMEIVPQLYSKALISREDYENVLAKRTTHERNMVLLESLQRAAIHSPDSFVQFLQVLAEHPSCTQVAEMLRKSVAEHSERSSVQHARTKTVTEEVRKDGGRQHSRSSGDLTPVSSGLKIGDNLPSELTSVTCCSSSADSAAESYHSAAEDELQILGHQTLDEVATLPRATHEMVAPISLPKDDTESFSQHSDSGKGSSASSRRNSTEMTQAYLGAVLSGSEEGVLELLRDSKVNVDVTLRDTMTALMIAAADGRSGIVRILLEFHASVTITDQNGCTPLHLAASRGNYEPVKQLVAAVSDVNATAKDGSSVLISPASKGFSVIVQYLLENAANPNIANKLGHTPLIVAAARNHKDVVEVLLEYKADVSAATLDTSKTALQEAIDHNYTEIITILLKASATAGAKSQAMFSCKTAERVQQLLKEGAKVNDKRGDGSTPLIAHAESGNLSVVKELISVGANVDEKDQSQMSALMKASKQGLSEIAQELVNAQAILDLKSQSGKTALMYAAQNRHTAVAECLVAAGANITLKDKSGRTALEIASEVKCPEIVTLLKDQSAIASDSKDPFLRLLSSYLDQFSKQQPENKHAAPTKSEDEVKVKTVSKRSPNDSEASTFSDQLKKAWKRIADLETRVHDLTLQSTMEIPEGTDLSYFDRGRLETEYHKMKGLKKKFEQYAIDAKQTAQRLSAENFKLKEDLTKERHAHEIRHKDMLSEMEEKFDRAAIASIAREDQAEVFQREVSIAARELVRLNPTHVELTPQTSCSPKDIKELILTHTVRASILQVGVGGLPYSGKSTLVKSLLKLSKGEDFVWKGFDDGLSVYEAVRMRDALAEVCEWIPASKENAIVISVAAALAQVCLQKHINLTIPEVHAALKLFDDPQIDAHFSEVLKGVAKLVDIIKDHKATPAVLSRASLTYINVMDVGHNKALYEVLTIFASGMKNFLLLDVLDLKRDSETLYQRHSLTDRSKYPLYQEKGKNKLLSIRSTLAYYSLFMLTAKKAAVSTNYPAVLLVGTHADQLETSRNEARKNILMGVKARANDFGLSDVVYSGIAAVDARIPDDVTEFVRKELDKLIDQNHRFERDIRLSWIFLRTVLHSTKKMYMPKCELMPYAKKCGLIDENELEEFLLLFKDVGSILYSSTSECQVLHENVILDPVSFIHGMDKLYYALDRCDDIPENLLPDHQLLSEGFLTINFAHHIWLDRSPDFYLQTLEGIGVIAHIPTDYVEHLGFRSGSKIYFMPTLRPNFWSEKPSLESNSLIISGESFHRGHLIVHRQSEFLLYLLQHYHEYFSLKRNREYNVLHFQWSSPNLKADVYIRFVVVYAEIEIKPCSTVETEDYDFLCSVLKTASIEIFGRSNEYFHLGFICPHSDGKEYPDGLHFLPFHPLALERNRLYCHHKCSKFIPLNEKQKRWIRAPYKGPQDCLPGDCLSVSMAEEIAQELSNLTQREVHTLAGALGFTEKEVEDKLATHPSTYDILLMLLLRFRQRNPVTARKSLAEALLKCEHYTMALRLHPKFLTGSTPIPHPLTTKELALISQYIQNWQMLAKCLEVSSDQVEHIKHEHKSTSDQCYQMLRLWERNYTASAARTRPEPDSNTYTSQSPHSSDHSSLSDPIYISEQTNARSVLICALQDSGAHGQKLASYLETGHADMLLK